MNQTLVMRNWARLRLVISGYGFGMIVVTGFALVLHLWGIQQDLPFTPEVDEPRFVTLAVKIADSGNLNPGWFGHPGSTVIYPLAGLYRLWHAIGYMGLQLHSNGVRATFELAPGAFYLLGRYWVMAFSIGSAPLVYLIGRRVFNKQVGVIGAWLAVLSPISLAQAQIVRTDAPGLFFALAALWLCLRLHQRPTLRLQVLVGAVIGAGIATRYFLATLIPLLLTVDILIWRGRRVESRDRTALWRDMIAGFVAIGVAFLALTPFFVLDFRTVWHNLRDEATSSRLGSDGLSPLANLLWYLTSAIPDNITWPRMILAAFGIVLIIRKRRPQALLLLWFATIFLSVTSLSRLHWERWAIQVLPMFALFVAHALEAVTRRLTGRLSLRPPFGLALMLSLAIILSAESLYRLAIANIQQSSPSTRVGARDWILANLPPGSHIAQEWYTAPLTLSNFNGYASSQGRLIKPSADNHFMIFEKISLAAAARANEYYRDGYRYLVVSSWMFDRYLAEADRYPSEAAFYRNLFAEGTLLQEFKPSLTQGGPVIRIYELPEPGG